MQVVRVFISSPRDCLHERQRAQRVIERLNGEYRTVLRFEPVMWESRHYGAHASFQDAIPEARECDIVAGVLWSRLGLALPDTFERLPPEHALVPGEPYPSGTAYELLSSIFARRAFADPERRPQPDVYVFRKEAPALLDLGDGAAIAEARDQWQRLEAFFERWFRGKDGVYRAAFQTFKTTDELEARLDDLLRQWIRDHNAAAARVVWSAERGSPFRGLAAFEARHAPVFFGRDRKIARAIELLKDAKAAADASSVAPDAPERRPRPFLLVVGPSGSGKSSLMLAGIGPRLTVPGVVPGVDVWRTAALRPGDAATPFEALARALLEPPDGDSAGVAALPELAGVAPGRTR